MWNDGLGLGLQSWSLRERVTEEVCKDCCADRSRTPLREVCDAGHLVLRLQDSQCDDSTVKHVTVTGSVMST